MRTRIALAAIVPIAIITVTALMQAATVQSARAAAGPPSGATITHPPAHLAANRRVDATGTGPARSSLLLDLNGTLLARAVPTPAPASGPPRGPAPTVAAATGPVDTVTPGQRAAWERVAMCEEGGNWTADSARFSGGLGITRANWSNYGGQAYAPEGAMATEDQQIMVAERIQPNPPDGYGCHGW